LLEMGPRAENIRYYHTLKILEEKCQGRMRCMRKCPTQAIRVRGGKAHILEELCIDCGECITVCPEGAIVPLTDPLEQISKFKCRVAIPSPVLYSQFSVDIHPPEIFAGLKKLGFDYVHDVSLVCEAISEALRLYLQEHSGPWPLISSFCPAVIRLIQVEYPGLTDHIIPLEVPRELAAKEMKLEFSRKLNLPLEEIGAVYFTSCPAKVVSIRQPAEKERSWLDGSISIADIYSPLLSAILSLEEGERDDLYEPSPIGMGWVVLGGSCGFLEPESWVAVSGIVELTKILDDIEKSKLREVRYVEASFCAEGCIGGPLAVENAYVARVKTIRLENRYGKQPRIQNEEVQKLYREGHYFLEKRIQPRLIKPLHPEVAKAIALLKEKEEIHNLLPRVDCGLCGCPTCLAFAEDVVKGLLNVSDCVYNTIRRRSSR
jgi:iron only hydrogenase large subunit-like protein